VYQVSTCFLSHASYNSCSASLGEEVELLIFFQPSTISVGLYDSLVLFISMEGYICNIPEIGCFPMCEFSQKIKTF
jgi:hypothetical protein